MKQIGVTEWRSRLGEMRQGTEVFVVLYRQKPAALLIPVPPAYWQDVAPFLERVLDIRDRQLRPPARETAHPWLELDAPKPFNINFEEARRGTAVLFGHLARNTPVVLTFYSYANAIMLPLPSDLPSEALKTIHKEAQAYTLAPE